MTWYWWKRGRFAWACSTGRPLQQTVRDVHGDWICLIGKLNFLIRKSEWPSRGWL